MKNSWDGFFSPCLCNAFHWYLDCNVSSHCVVPIELYYNNMYLLLNGGKLDSMDVLIHVPAEY